MEQGFLVQESKQANKRNRKIFLTLFFVYICLIAIIIFAVKDSVDLNDYTTKKLIVCLYIGTGIMLICVTWGLFNASRVAVNGKNLILPFKENTKEAVGKIIDQEVSEGKIQVEEYIYEFPEGKKPYGERVILTPSYLLLCQSMGKITAIPRDKIYWICAQVGHKGSSSFIVRLLIFTEKRTFYMEGTKPEHVEQIADKLYQYIPNVFSDYDPFILSYELDKLFTQNREAFLEFYEDEKKKNENN